MERRMAYFILLGATLGALLGVGFGVANGNMTLGIVVVAMAGLFIGWFAAAADLQKRGGGPRG